jgi:hypothetical protein
MSYSIKLNKTGLGMDEHLMENHCQIVIDKGFLATQGLAHAKPACFDHFELWIAS